MSLEQGDYISDLVDTNPTAGDPVSQGDDHIRLIKRLILQTFPNLDGPVLATPGELNETGNPIGSMTMFAGAESKVPVGWLLCDGAELSRTTHLNLYEAIGTTWGDGDGVNTFNLPDMRARVPAGADNDLAKLIEPGTLAGKDTWAQADMPSQSMGTAGEHRHSIVWGVSNDFEENGTKNGIENIKKDTTFYTNSTGDHVHSLSNSGSSTVDNRQRSAYVNYIIRS